jgi:hypothetical protein
MFELHVVVAGIVMFNILELIMEIVPNSPTLIHNFRMCLFSYTKKGMIKYQKKGHNINS